uniref:TRAP transporter small permease subunit n=1 Tax=Limnohabitans sp. TaxID=1907725 RepID=UPI00404824E9
MYKHLSREERYQIHSLLKAKQTITEIARSLGRSRSTISRELSRGRGQRGYRAEQACAKASERAQRSRNARRVDSKVWVDEVVGFLLVVIVTLAAADVLRRGEHIGVDIFTSQLGPRGRRWAQAWATLAALATALVLIVNGWETAMFSRMLGIVTEGHLELPAFWLILFLPLGGLLMLLTALEALLRLGSGAPSLAHHAHLPGDEK